MKVRDLIKALQAAPQGATVRGFNTDDQNEFTITVVTLSLDTILLSSDMDEVTASEKVLHADLTEEDGQFGAGA